MKHVKMDTGEGLFHPQDVSVAGAGPGMFVQFPYSGESRNSRSCTP